MSKQRVLVTGGAGFIGSHLCERLLQGKDEVICLDNFNDFYDPRIKEDNIASVLECENFLLMRGDVLDRELLEGIFSKHSIDKIVHLAAVAGVRASLATPNKYIEVDVKGTVNLLELAREYKIVQFVFGSSSSVYGVNPKIPFSESDMVDLQVSPYATAKRSAELFCATYHYLYGIPTTILRFFTVYGPRQRPDMAFHKFTRLMSQGKAVPIFGNGESERDYTYIDDAVGGIKKSLEKAYDFEVFNIGNSKTIKLHEVVRILASELDAAPTIEQLPEQLGDVLVTYADISKARRMLDYAPLTSFTCGIERFVEWYLSKKRLLSGPS